METIKEMSWCIPCMLAGFPEPSGTTIQHVVEGNKRLGHSMSYGCCGWHHLGLQHEGWSRQKMLKVFGPSLALSRKQYRLVYGDERKLVKLQDKLLDLFAESPWEPYLTPKVIRYDIQREALRDDRLGA